MSEAVEEFDPVRVTLIYILIRGHNKQYIKVFLYLVNVLLEELISKAKFVVKFSLVSKVVDFPLGHYFNVRFRHNSDQKVEQDNLHHQLVHYHQDPDTADHC